MKVLAIAISEKKGVKKTVQPEVIIKKGYGIVNDAHGGNWHRQISLLANESIEKMRRQGLDVTFGSFAENIATEGIELNKLELGTRLKIGGEVVLGVTQIGKTCHERCAIYYQAGDCVMPKEGIFATVLKEGKIKPGDPIEIIPSYTAAILTVSDKGFNGERVDTAGPAAKLGLAQIGIKVEQMDIVPDEHDKITEKLQTWVDSNLSIVITSGGTGLSPRDITPEATQSFVDKEVPGIMEMIRSNSSKYTPKAYLTRGICGISDNTLIINLPGSEKAVKESMGIISPILEHALETLQGKTQDCGR
ncbi:molybdenum cofactor synthesis domain-containing protein [Proteinivorax tanatarense]|uniref:Molybdenum cofactor synthesis domain-containing protein n=1 Tax=Proteinivorax tanatarense TaxID=1260629 RepID=A0AAU7VIC2_9FIRM